MTASGKGCWEFECTLPAGEGEEGQKWQGGVLVRSRSTDMAELLIYGRGSCMDAIVGKYGNGQYICVPDLDIGCPLSRLTDTFWNQERLSFHVGEVDAVTMANALEAVSGYLEGGWV